MNKGTMMALHLISIIALMAKGGLEFFRGAEKGYGSGPSGIPHKGRTRQHRSHAPNDGHWHMKFHRGRQ